MACFDRGANQNEVILSVPPFTPLWLSRFDDAHCFIVSFSISRSDAEVQKEKGLTFIYCYLFVTGL